MSFRNHFSHPTLLAVLSAALVWFAFPNFLERTLAPSTAFLGWIALVPFFLAIEGKTPGQGARLGWIFGFAQFGGILYWIGLIEAAKSLSWLGWFFLVLYLSLYPTAFGLLWTFFRRRLAAGPWLAGILWVALEYVRGTRPWGGFSWGELGYSQSPYPSVLTFTVWGGVYGLTFLMVWFNASLAMALAPKRDGMSGERGRWSHLACASSVLLLVLLHGGLSLRGATLEKKGRVVMLQPSIPQDEKWSKANERATYERLGTLVDGSKGMQPDLFLWPETAAPNFLSWSPDALKRVEGIVRRSGSHHLVGCLDAEKGLQDPKTRSYNAAMAFGPNGLPSGSYHKRHLVPFGEFVPFQRYLSFLGPVIGDLGHFDRGERYEKFQAAGFTYTPMICYEVIFPGDVYEAFKTGADLLVNISNDAWYGRTASAYQHAQMAVVRAAEHRRPILRSSNAGVCLATDPFGRVIARTGLFEVRTLAADVLLWKGPATPYGRYGNWFPRSCWALLVLLGVWAWRKGPRPLHGIGP